MACTSAPPTVVAIIIGVAAAILIAGCDAWQPGQPEQSAVPSVTLGHSVAPPDGFPIISGARAVPFGDSEIAGRWESDEAGPTVYGHYLEALPAAGFRELQAAPGGAAAIIRFEDREGTAWQLDLRTIDGPLDGTEITLRRPRP